MGTTPRQTSEEKLTPLSFGVVRPPSHASLGLDIADRLTLVVASEATLLVDAHGPDRPMRVPGYRKTIWWQNWQAASDNGDFAEAPSTVAQVVAGEAPAAAKRTYDLVVCNDNALIAGVSQARRLCEFLVNIAPRVAMLSPAKPQSETLSLPQWAGLLANSGYFRAFDVDLGLVSGSLALFEDRELSVDDLARSYERALAAANPANSVEAADTGLNGEQNKELMEARHQALRDRDRAIGLLAHSSSLQNETDLLRISLEVATRRLAKAHRQLSGLKAGRRYRIGNAFIKPAAAAKRVLRRNNGGTSPK